MSEQKLNPSARNDWIAEDDEEDDGINHTPIPTDEASPIFNRIKFSLDLNQIKSVNPKMVQEELLNIMKQSKDWKPKDETKPQNSIEFLAKKGLHERMTEDNSLFKQLLDESGVEQRLIQNIKQGHVSYPKRKKKVSYTFYYIGSGLKKTETRSGKIIKGGRRLKGKTRQQAEDSLRELIERKQF